jgi:hypothetical protein
MKWQARRDLNPHHPDLESGALSVRATGLYPLVYDSSLKTFATNLPDLSIDHLL